MAKNFCKAYGLDKDMQTSLTAQLNGHLILYYKKRGEPKIAQEQPNIDGRNFNDNQVEITKTFNSTTFEHMTIANES